MARGGSRQGTPGTTYTNRSDLNAPKVNFDGGYGDDTAQAPLQQARTAAPAPQAVQQAPQGPLPSLHGPTSRPGEPLTAGAGIGAGAGPEAVGLGGTDHLSAMRAAYSQFPDPDLMRAILDEEERSAG